MPLIIWGINIMLTWSTNYVMSSNGAASQATIFTMTDTKLYVPVATLSTQNNIKLP